MYTIMNFVFQILFPTILIWFLAAVAVSSVRLVQLRKTTEELKHAEKRAAWKRIVTPAAAFMFAAVMFGLLNVIAA